VFKEPFSVLGNWALEELSLGPEIWGKVLVGLGKSVESSLDEVLSSSGHTNGHGVDIIDTSELEHLL
jgi:hypothetical protein